VRSREKKVKSEKKVRQVKKLTSKVKYFESGEKNGTFRKSITRLRSGGKKH